MPSAPPASSRWLAFLALLALLVLRGRRGLTVLGVLIVLWAAPAYGQLMADDACPALLPDLASIDCGEPREAAAAAVSELSPEQAWQLKRRRRSSMLFIDLRDVQAERFLPLGVDVVAPYRELEIADALRRHGSRSSLLVRFSARIDVEVQARGHGRSMPILLICASGELAYRAAATLQTMGYLDLSVVAGGVDGGVDRAGRTVQGWKSAGLPGRELTAAGPAALLRQVSY